MTNRIYYGSQALLLKSCTKDAGMTNYFIPGVQAVGIDGDAQQIVHSSNGRIQEHTVQYIPSEHDITIDRVLGTEDVFWTELSSNFLRNQNRSNFTYLNSRIVNNNIFGTHFSAWQPSDEATIKATNIPEYRFWLMLDPNENGIIESMTGNSGTVQDVIDIDHCLLSSLSYNMDINGYFTETISLIGKSKKRISDTSFTLDSISGLTNPVTYNSLLKRQHIYNNLSVYPNTVQTIIDFNQYFNGQEVFGLQNIKVDLNFNYEQYYFGSAQQSSKSNWHTFLSLPLQVNSTFTITARRMPNLNMDEILSVLLEEVNTYQRIAIVAGIGYNNNIKFFIWNLGSKNRLTSISQSGGDTDSSSVNYDITFTNTNDFMTYTQVQSSDTVLNPSLVEQTTEKY